MPEKSINYDRAADFYDATRGYPEGIAEQLAEFIAQKALFKPDTNLLEVGVGTGRVAVPLSAHVGKYTGIDIARKMMLKLREKLTTEPIQLAQADGGKMPFAANTFKHVLVSHVLHLVPDPQFVLREISRVLKRPGQLVHINSFSDNPPQFDAINNEWRKHRKAGAMSAFERARTGEFFLPSDWHKIEEHRFIYPTTDNPKYYLDAVKNRWWSNMWDLSDAEIEVAYLAMERVVREQFGENYDVELESSAGITLQVYLPKR